MNLEEVNNFIAKLVKNEDFAQMLDPKNESIVQEAFNISNNSLISYPNKINNDIIKTYAIVCDNYKEVIKNFYSELGIPKDDINELFDNVEEEKNLKRAYHSGADGKIHIKPYDDELQWLITFVHEAAHKIRKKYAPDADRMSCEIESMFAEDLFYKYLIDKGYEIQDQNKTRKINTIDFYNKRLQFMNDNIDRMHRVNREKIVIDLLTKNMRKNQNYFFTLEQYNEFSEKEKNTMIKFIEELRKKYLPDYSVNFNFEKINECIINSDKKLNDEYRLKIDEFIKFIKTDEKNNLNSFNYKNENVIDNDMNLECKYSFVFNDEVIKKIKTGEIFSSAQIDFNSINFKKNYKLCLKNKDCFILDNSFVKQLANDKKSGQVGLNDFKYIKSYFLHGGNQLSNEFKFILADLFTNELINNKEFCDNFGSYLTDKKMNSYKDIMSKYNIENLDMLCHNVGKNYISMNALKNFPKGELNINYKNYNVSIVFPKKGDNFNIPYILAVPSNIKEMLINENQNYKPNIVMETNNLETSSSMELINNGLFTINNLVRNIKDNNATVLVPIIPSPSKDSPYYQQLSKECLELDKKNPFYRIDEQVKNIINKVKNDVKNNYGVSLNDKIFLNGYSSSGVFAERFALIQPEIVDSVCIGGASGSIPLPSTVLDYPLGIRNYKELTGKDFNIDAYSKIKFNYYVGEYEMLRKADNRYDEFGNSAPMHDMSYFDRSVPSEVGQQQRNLFGINLIDRSNKQIKLLQENGFNVDNQLIIKGRGHNNFQNIIGVNEYADKYIKYCYEEFIEKNKQKIEAKDANINEKQKPKQLVYKNENIHQNNNGYISALMLSLITAFFSGFVFALTLLLIK